MKLVHSKANPIWHFRHQTRGPRRIVHVPQQFASQEWTGTESVVLELAKQQFATGMVPVIISSLVLSDIRHETIDGIRVQRHSHSYPFFGSGNGGTGTQHEPGDHLLAIPIFQSLMQEPEVRLFHAHTLGRMGSEVRNAARMRGRPFVVSVHDRLFSEGPREMVPASEYTDGAIGDGHGLSVVSGWGEELADADMVIVSDKAEANLALATLGHDRIAYLPPGINFARLSTGVGCAFRANHAIPRKAFVVGAFGRAGVEGNNVMIDAFSKASPRHAGVHLVLTEPEGQPDYAEWLTSVIQQHCLEGKIHLVRTSEMQDRTYVDSLHACDALVVVSSEESAKRDLLAAWSTGKAVVACSAAGIEKLGQDGETGLFFAPETANTAEQITTRIDRLSSDEALCRDLGAKGRTEAQAHDWTRIGAKLEEIYQLAENHHQYAREQGRKAA